ncbi:MAG: DUF3501 family protein [Acidobacteriota bacterium]
MAALLTMSDIRNKHDYEGTRPNFRRRIMVAKQKRRVIVGDHCSVHFESRDTMLYQVHEMLRAEDSWNRPGAVEGELHAYNPLISQPGELSATLMLEYETPEERASHLPEFAGIDRHLWLQIGDSEPIRAEFDRSQIDERGVSSVQYVKWTLDPRRVDLLGQDGTVVRLVIDHPAYLAQAVISEDTRREIASDPR